MREVASEANLQLLLLLHFILCSAQEQGFGACHILVRCLCQLSLLFAIHPIAFEDPPLDFSKVDVPRTMLLAGIPRTFPKKSLFFEEELPPAMSLIRLKPDQITVAILELVSSFSLTFA